MFSLIDKLCCGTGTRGFPCLYTASVHCSDSVPCFQRAAFKSKFTVLTGAQLSSNRFLHNAQEFGKDKVQTTASVCIVDFLDTSCIEILQSCSYTKIPFNLSQVIKSL